MKHVSFARGRYAVRITVPPELRQIVGKRELVEPLGADKKAAEKRAHGVIAGFLAHLDEARAKLDASRPNLSTIAKAHYRLELAADDQGRAAAGTRSVATVNRHFGAERATLLRLVAAGQIVGEEAEALVGYAVDALAETGLVSRDHLQAHDRGTLLRSLAEAQLDVLTRMAERDQGVAIPTPLQSPLLTQADQPPVAPVGPADRGKGATLGDILAAFHRERTAGNRTLAEKTMEEHRVAVRMLEEFLGGKVPARSITRQDMLDYKQALLSTPSRYSIRFPGLTLPQAIKANAKRAEPFDTLDPQTINMKWLSHVSTICKWAMNNGLLDANPAAGVRVDEGKGYKEPTRVPFTQDDLDRLFGSAFYQETPRAKWGTQHWALVLALYTGARSSSELARIRLSDVYQEQGVDVINLALASKNVRSKRLVPVHTHLKDLGFLDHVERLRKKGGERLFPDWEPEDKVNRWFLRTYRDEVGVTDRRKVFHSFRHTLKTALARYGVNRDVSDLITGHKDQSVGGIYIGDASVTMVQAMSDGLNRVDFKLPIMKGK
ncbi:MAG: site-specific integrase [Mesorhizobium sp.]|nr:site-specific integrase [Mesorhizobium sp.]MCO5159827.1 site-specific integrase [Mesorhizobium sp.]